MEKIDWSSVDAAKEGYAAPPAGGYVLQIKKVEDWPSKEYVKVFYDTVGVADPKNEEFVGYYTERFNRSGGQIQLPVMYRSYKKNARGFFKAFLQALEESNTGFIANRFDGDEAKLANLVFGAVLCEEEYVYNEKLRVRLKVNMVCSAERIAKGDFKVPPIKKYEGEISAAPAQTPGTTSLPFVDEVPF